MMAWVDGQVGLRDDLGVQPATFRIFAVQHALEDMDRKLDDWGDLLIILISPGAWGLVSGNWSS